jgi:hypothetical protein
MNRTMRRFVGVVASLLATALLSACGGGDGDGGASSNAVAAQLGSGLWTGTTDTNRKVTAVSLSDGRYYVIYDRVATPGTTGGLLEGSDSAVFNAFSFTSTDAKDYSLESVPGPVTTGTVRADVLPRTSFNGTLARSNATGFNFNTNYDSDFNTTPTLSAVQGTYTGTVTFSLGPRAGVFTVDATGGVTSVINGCSITGQLTPRTDGNIYDLSITFGPSPCVFPSQTITGIGYYRAATRQLLTATTGTATVNPAIIPGDAPSPEGVVFVGTKP